MVYHKKYIEDVTEPPRFKSGSISLVDKRPDAGSFWCYQKNCGWGPEDFSSGSGILAWFQCDKGPDHIYQTQIKKWATAQDTSSLGCPFCHGLYISETNWLHNFPEVSAELNSRKSGGITAKDIVAHSKTLCWWSCAKCGHEWEATPCDRVSGHGCYRCNVGEPTDLRKYPKALRLFDRSKNKNKNVDPYNFGKETVVDWSCPKGSDHKFRQRFYKMNYPKSPRCPYCYQAVASSTNNLGLNPNLLAQLHPSKNGKPAPKAKDIALNSPVFLWWKCAAGPDHEWRARVGLRALGSGCPFCSYNRFSITHSLALVAPEIARDFDVKRNKPLKPERIAASSLAIVHWRCSMCNHKWRRSVFNQVKSARCPQCKMQKMLPPRGFRKKQSKRIKIRGLDNTQVKKLHSLLSSQLKSQQLIRVRSIMLNSKSAPLSVTHPLIAKQWHPTRNKPWTAADFTSMSSIGIWWKCPLGPDHIWNAPTAARTSSTSDTLGCPFCASKLVSSTNSLAALFPQVAAMLHPSKNGAVKASQIIAGSSKRYWWLCPSAKDHVWEEAVSPLTSAGQGCPFCANSRVSKSNSIAGMFPDLRKQWHPHKNGDLRPADVIAGSHRKVWWLCPEGLDHEWEEMPLKRCYQKIGCPFCAGRRVSITNSLASRNADLAKEWHPTKNGILTPHDVTIGTHSIFWWKCPAEKDHEWQQSVKVRNGRRCPFCASRRVTKSGSLGVKFPNLAREFHKTKNETITPFDLAPFSGKKVWWQCMVNNKHIWQAVVSSRTSSNSGCPLCYKQSVPR